MKKSIIESDGKFYNITARKEPVYQTAWTNWTLTSNTSNGFNVSSVPVGNTTYNVWRMFDSGTASTSYFRTNTSSPTAVITIQLPSPMRFVGLKLTRYNTTAYPTIYELHGSNDNVEWTALSNGSFLSDTNTFIEAHEFKNKNKYLYYRFSVLATSTTTYVYIKELQFLEVLTDTPYEPAKLVELPIPELSKSAFDNYGMTDLKSLTQRLIKTSIMTINQTQDVGGSGIVKGELDLSEDKQIVKIKNKQ